MPAQLMNTTYATLRSHHTESPSSAAARSSQFIEGVLQSRDSYPDVLVYQTSSMKDHLVKFQNGKSVLVKPHRYEFLVTTTTKTEVRVFCETKEFNPAAASLLNGRKWVSKKYKKVEKLGIIYEVYQKPVGAPQEEFQVLHWHLHQRIVHNN